MNLIERIQAEMMSDDDDLERQSEHLTLVYNQATENEKRVLDSAFIALCGYSLTTLIKE